MRLTNRFGRFWIQSQTIEQWSKLVRFVMGKMIVVRCEHDYRTQNFVYEAWSELFEQQSPNFAPTDYRIEVADGVVLVERITMIETSLTQFPRNLLCIEPNDGRFTIALNSEERLILHTAADRIEADKFFFAFTEAKMIGKGTQRALEIALDAVK